jgi:hypothetical protein
VVRIVAVDEDGQVHFTVLPGSVAKNRHLIGRSVAWSESVTVLKAVPASPTLTAPASSTIGTKAERRAAREHVAAYHELRLGELLAHVRIDMALEPGTSADHAKGAPGTAQQRGTDLGLVEPAQRSRVHWT